MVPGQGGTPLFFFCPLLLPPSLGKIWKRMFFTPLSPLGGRTLRQRDLRTVEIFLIVFNVFAQI